MRLSKLAGQGRGGYLWYVLWYISPAIEQDQCVAKKVDVSLPLSGWQPSQSCNQLHPSLDPPITHYPSVDPSQIFSKCFAKSHWRDDGTIKTGFVGNFPIYKEGDQFQNLMSIYQVLVFCTWISDFRCLSDVKGLIAKECLLMLPHRVKIWHPCETLKPLFLLQNWNVSTFVAGRGGRHVPESLTRVTRGKGSVTGQPS